jgi:hypothetical protein
LESSFQRLDDVLSELQTHTKKRRRAKRRQGDRS